MFHTKRKYVSTKMLWIMAFFYDYEVSPISTLFSRIFFILVRVFFNLTCV